MTEPAQTRITVSVMMDRDELDFLESHLRPTDRLVEWGGGGSSAWLANRVSRLYTVEHDAEWAVKTIAMLPSKNASLLYHPPDLPYEDFPEDGNGGRHNYVVNPKTGKRVAAQYNIRYYVRQRGR